MSAAAKPFSNAVIADAAERARALDPQQSFIVQAPAGSGKTELLVRRFVALLATVQQPEEVLAITFTRKAAAEMKKRVLAALDAEQAARLASRLRIMTIDSLCASLTRQMPVLARFGAQPGIVEGAEAKALYHEAAQRTLARLELPGSLARQVAQLLLHLDNDSVAAEGLLADMLSRRDQWLRRAGDPPTRVELEATLLTERERLLEAARVLHPDASEELALQVLTQKGGWRKRPPAPPDMVGNEALRLALFALHALPPARYSDEQWAVLEAILGLLKLAAAELKLVFGERGQADFTEYAQAAVVALGSADDPSELLLRMDATLRHILVDEFQDTSVSQWALLEHLTAGWEAGDGRTIFVVGDPMQSIYRFREAEVALFLRARRAGLGEVHLEPLTLRTNFRSQAGIVDWVNDSFTQVLPAVEDEAAGAVPYSAAIAHPDKLKLEGAAVSWHIFTASNAGADSKRDSARADEAQRVLQIAREARLQGGSCAVLVRNRLALIDIVPALEQAGIPYRAVEIEKLGEKQVIQDLHALTRALLHPGDRIAWLALLRARWCGLDLADLYALAGSDEQGDTATRLVWDLMQDPARLATLSADGQARIARLPTVLAPALAQALRGSLRQRIEGAWLALGGPACVDEATELEDAAIFLARLDELEEAGDLEDPALLADSLEALYALPDVNAGEEALQIMTVHKSKGLEFDTVILPGLDRSPRPGQRQLMAWKSMAGRSLLLAPINATREVREPLYQHVRAQLRAAEDTEAGRLLYVAATRAKQRLHLLGCLKRDKEGFEKPPGKRSLLALLWPLMPDDAWVAAGDGAPPGVAVAKQAESSAVPAGAPLRLPLDWQPAALPPRAAWPAWLDAPAAAGGEVIEFSWTGETTRHIGSVVHRWLQRIADTGLAGWDAARIAAHKPDFRMELSALGVEPATQESAAARVADALVHSITDARGRWLLGPQQDARNEYRLSTLLQGRPRHFVIDRSFTDAEGRRWIIDYKTGRHEGGDIEAFLDREQLRYRGQLETYAMVLPRDPAVRLRFGLYFPLLGGWREWGLDE